MTGRRETVRFPAEAPSGGRGWVLPPRAPAGLARGIAASICSPPEKSFAFAPLGMAGGRP